MMGSADYKTVDHAVDHHHQPDDPAQLTGLFAATGLYGHDSSRVAVYQVVPSCSCYRCVDLSFDRDSGTSDYAIELPLFRSSIILRALTGKDANSPAHAHRRC